jgi:hypothetical protein
VSKLDRLKAHAAEIQRQIDIIESHARGETIQLKYKDGNDKWVDLTNTEPGWNFYDFDFRKKPEPVVIYCNKYHAPGIGYYWRAYCGIDECRALAPKGAIEIAVKFVEVVE